MNKVVGRPKKIRLKIKGEFKGAIKIYKQYLIDIKDDEETNTNIKELIIKFLTLELWELNLLALRIIYNDYSYKELAKETGLDKDTYIKLIKNIKRKLKNDIL